MKKSLLAIVGGFFMLAATSTFTESLTTVYNETNQDIGITWTAAKDWAKFARSVASVVKNSKFTFIAPGKSDWFTHSGDALVVKYVSCDGGKPVSQELTYDALGNGYGKDGLVVKWNAKKTEMIVEKRD